MLIVARIVIRHLDYVITYFQFLRPNKIIPTVNISNAANREKQQSYFKQWLNGWVQKRTGFVEMQSNLFLQFNDRLGHKGANI